MPKQVSFANTNTVVEFNLGYGISTAPHAGPAIGLTGKAIRISKIPTELSAARRTKRALYLDPIRRAALLHREGYTMEQIKSFCWDAERVKQQRRETILEFVIEKRKLAKELAASSTTSGSIPVTYPATCQPAFQFQLA